jgi:8-oxo-dGTP diphosphatase
MKYGTMGYLICDKGILMLKKVERENDPNSGYYTLPGGKLEPYEKGLDNLEGRTKSVIREIWDETGVTLINPVLRGVILFDNKDRIFDNWPNPDNFFVQIYSATDYTGELKESDEGIPFWIPSLKEIESLPKNPGDKKVYEWLKNGRNFVGVIKHKENEIDEEGTWVDYIL